MWLWMETPRGDRRPENPFLAHNPLPMITFLTTPSEYRTPISKPCMKDNNTARGLGWHYPSGGC
jgi:hypothetical protein